MKVSKKKRDYIKQVDVVLPKYYLEVWFSRFNVKEIELGKDLSEFTKEEILDFYKDIHTTSVLILENINTQMQKYSVWVGNENNAFKDINLKILETCLDKDKIDSMFIRRKDVIDLCQLMINPRDKMITLGIFEGIKGKNYSEFACMKNEDFDFDHKKIYLRATDRMIHISDELANYIEQTIESTEYYPTSGRHREREYEFKNSEYIIKPFYNQVNFESEYRRGRNIYMALTRNLKIFNMENLSSQSIYESGIIYYINMLATKYETTTEKILKNKHTQKLIIDQFGRIPKISLLSKYRDKLK